MNEVLKYFLISSAIFLFIIILGGFVFRPNTSQTPVFKEAPLVKNTNLVLISGERYAYNYHVNNSDNVLSFLVSSSGECTFISVEQSVNASGVCLDSRGNDRTGSNFTFSTPYVNLFRPWMLAIGSDWKWQVNMTVSTFNTELVLKTFYLETIGEESIFGRPSYVVRMSSDNESLLDWIDKEKRVLLKEQGRDYVIELVQAPFELNGSN